MALPTEQDLEQCMCPRCPSFVQGGGQLFCVNGKSEANPVERGCFCRTCPVHIKHHLKSRAFCLRGKAEE
jgi:hypothetical protein